MIHMVAQWVARPYEGMVGEVGNCSESESGAQPHDDASFCSRAVSGPHPRRIGTDTALSAACSGLYRHRSWSWLPVTGRPGLTGTRGSEVGNAFGLWPGGDVSGVLAPTEEHEE